MSATNLLTKEDKTDIVREMKTSKEELIIAIEKSKRQVITWLVGTATVNVVLTIFVLYFFQQG